MSCLFYKDNSQEISEDGLEKGKIKEERTVKRTFNTMGRIWLSVVAVGMETKLIDQEFTYRAE